MLRTGVNFDLYADDAHQSHAGSRDIFDCSNRSPEGPTEGVGAPDGIGIGIAVAEVEDIMAFADVFAELVLTNAHERMQGSRELK